MTTHEALRALELRSMPQTADQIGQAFARKAQGIQALLQFPLGNKARSPLLDELVTLQDAHNVLMQMVSQRPPLVKNAAPAPNGVGPGIMTWARTALDSLRLLNEKIRHTAERVYEIGASAFQVVRAIVRSVKSQPSLRFILPWTITPRVRRVLAAGSLAVLTGGTGVLLVAIMMPRITAMPTKTSVAVRAVKETEHASAAISVPAPLAATAHVTNPVSSTRSTASMVPPTPARVQFHTYPPSTVFAGSLRLGEAPSPVEFTLEPGYLDLTLVSTAGDRRSTTVYIRSGVHYRLELNFETGDVKWQTHEI